jgi:hypothetical protein
MNMTLVEDNDVAATDDIDGDSAAHPTNNGRKSAAK